MLKTEPRNQEGAKKQALCPFSLFWAKGAVGGGAGRVAVGLVGWQARKQLLPSSQSMGSKKKVERKDISLLWLRKHW